VVLLLTVLDDEDLQFEDARGGGWTPVHATRILGELRTAEAVEPLTKWLGAEGEALAQAVPLALARIGEPALEPLTAYARDTSHDLMARAAALEALTRMIGPYPDYQDRVVETLREIVCGEERGEDEFRAFAVVNLCDISDDRAWNDIHTAYKQNRIAKRLITLNEARENMLARGGNWKLREAAESIVSQYEVPSHDAGSRAVRRRPTGKAALGPEFAKVGRNDPCPCGSGKKFKKCHGR
jgi:HEAT repeat protein